MKNKTPPLHPYAVDALKLLEIFSKFPHVSSLRFYSEGETTRYSINSAWVSLVEINDNSLNIDYVKYNSQKQEDLDSEIKSFLVEIDMSVEELLSVQALVENLSSEFLYAYSDEVITVQELKPFLKGRV